MNDSNKITNLWDIPKNIDDSGFDYSWRPDPYDPPYIHQFGTQWQKTGGPRYVVEGATQIKYHDHMRVIAIERNDVDAWQKNPDVDFDYSWHPDETEPPFIYQFADQWYKDGGPSYIVEGATEVKFIQHPVAIRKQSHQHWQLSKDLEDCDFDYSWYPHHTEPPFIHVFSTQWHSGSGPRYVAPDATQLKYHDFPVAKTKPKMDNWLIPDDIVRDSFDWSWTPSPHEPESYIYQFSTQWQKTGGPRYVVPGARKIKYVEQLIATRHQDKDAWQIPSNIDDSKFDYSWVPPESEVDPWIYQFGTQWQKTGGPRYVVEGATQIKYVDVQKVVKIPSKNNWKNTHRIDEFDWSWHPDDTAPPYIYQFPSKWNKSAGPRYVVPGATETIYMDSPVAKLSSNRRFWQIPENIDDTEFDYGWQPSETETSPYIYQFGTQWQKTGGPRYVVPGATIVKYMKEVDPSAPIVRTLPSTKNWFRMYDHEIDFDYSWHPDSTVTSYNYVFGNQWGPPQETPTVMYIMKSATQMKYCVDQKAIIHLKQSDIIFVSNGEMGADSRYLHLCAIAKRPVKWVKGISGRENALRQAAAISETPWFFCVPAKLMVDSNFDFDFQPSPYVDPKHYIFYATNPVNGLFYGHQAIVCYNKQHILDTTDYGLDFTMSKPHDVVKINSGIAQYDVDPFITWRTAFRETVKLMNALRENSDDTESAYRLDTWCNIGRGPWGWISKLGAQQGVEYYNSVDGDPAKLMLSFDWDWLRKYYRQTDVHKIVEESMETQQKDEE